jgi:CheY-like chemotaxis protein/REP element-mobilizing transposase RayT
MMAGIVATTSVLVVTSTQGFGELIQQSLEETGIYQVLLVDGSAEAMHCVRSMKFSLAIIDHEIKDGSLTNLATEIRELLPDIRLILIHPDNDPSNPQIKQITADGYLTKPFYLPDLFDTVAEALQKSPRPESPTLPAEVARAAEPPPPSVLPLDWLQDVNRAAQHLTRLSLESSAQAALIVRDGQLWAYAGQLSQLAAQELAKVVLNYWLSDRSIRTSASKSADMVRFVRLNATNEEYMLYATALGKMMVLALAFNSETPFSKIRSQAGQLARALSSPVADQSLLKTPLSRLIVSSSPKPIEPLVRKDVRPLLDDVPPPLPNQPQPQPPASSLPRQDQSPATDSGIFAPPGTKISIERSPAIHLSDMPGLSNRDLASHLNPERPTSEDSMPEPAPPSHLETKGNVPGSAPQSLIETQPGDVEDTAPLPLPVEEELRPITPAIHGLFYACLLIPRLPQHHLTGDLASQLSDWMSQLCLAFGWRLDFISIRPDYLQWIASVPPTTSPSYLMRVIRQQTSQRIFAMFPTLERDNPSGDFWAPGYLIMSSSQPPPPHVVKEFIQQTRHYQGAKP